MTDRQQRFLEIGKESRQFRPHGVRWHKFVFRDAEFYLFLCRLAIIYNATPPDATLPVSLVTGVLAGLISYCLYQFGLKNSRNKYGIREDGEPYREVINQYLDEV